LTVLKKQALCSRIAAKERETRLDKLREQLAEQEKNIAFLNANLLDCERVDALKKRADEVNSAIDALSEVGSFEERFERFLRDPIAAAGDSNVLSMQLAQCEDMLDELKNKEIVSSKHDQLQKLGIAKRNNIREMLEKTRQCDEKIIGSESALRQFRQRLNSLKSEQLEFPELIGHFRCLFL
uniref:Uncharacterized protein n=1 Tax=Parascaris equorum TaxID=6256 RepID=A0A914RL17_PAREQ